MGVIIIDFYIYSYSYKNYFLGANYSASLDIYKDYMFSKETNC